MATDERMSGALQENVLTLLCFDTEAARMIRAAITAKLFESRVYQDIASHAIEFLDKYGEAIAEHLPDVIEDVLSGDDRKKASLYKRTLENLYSARGHVNRDYIVGQLREFVHLQTLKTSILKAVDSIEAGKVDEAEIELQKGLQADLPSFDIGTSFVDTKESLSFFNTSDEGISLGIKAFDEGGIVAAPGTMVLFIAPAKKGKSWFLVHGGKYSLLQRKRVLVVTLEMSEAAYSMRFVQSLFSVTKRQARLAVPQFRRNDEGHFVGIDFEDVERPTLGDDGVRRMIEKNIKQRFRNWNPLIIKGWPMMTLTMQHFRVYLDTLERLHKFIPEVVVFDYPNLMKISPDNVRMETSTVFRELRGLATERGFALITATQGNRQAAEARTTMDTHVAEDYSVIATADVAITYSQTPEEKRLGLARLFVSNARNEEDKYSVIVTQSYAMGQFAIDSQRMHGDYWQRVDESTAPTARQRTGRNADAEE